MSACGLAFRIGGNGRAGHRNAVVALVDEFAGDAAP
jgi:hypothetical protein